MEINENLLLATVQKRQFFWEPIIAAAILLAAILGVMVPLYIHSDNMANSQINAIRQDIKEFHEELRRQDAEFKSRLVEIERARKG